MNFHPESNLSSAQHPHWTGLRRQIKPNEYLQWKVIFLLLMQWVWGRHTWELLSDCTSASPVRLALIMQPSSRVHRVLWIIEPVELLSISRLAAVLPRRSSSASIRGSTPPHSIVLMQKFILCNFYLFSRKEKHSERRRSTVGCWPWRELRGNNRSNQENNYQ